MSNNFTVLGMDIGYSSVKLSLHHNGEVTTFIYPNGAAERSALANNANLDGAFIFDHNGKQWVAGVEADRIQNMSRILDNGFIKTEEYEALVKSALLASGVKEIDLLVTGLPVNQTKSNKQDVDFLLEMIKKEHTIKNGYSVNVKNAYVVPQPVGAFVDSLFSYSPDSDESLLLQATALIVDPGFYSVDWVIFNNTELHESSSDTHNDAMNIVFRKVADKIGEDFSQVPSLNKVESAVRNKTHLVAGSSIIKNDKLMQYVKDLGHRYTSNPTKELRSRLESGDYNPNIIICGGGGATVYADAIKKDEWFKEIKVVVPDEPVLANARGYMKFGLNELAQNND